MSVIITAAGEALMARLQAAGLPLVIDTFIFADVPGLDCAQPLPPETVIPAEHVVLEYPIPAEFRTCINANQVVYSALLGSDVGDFSFNWQGLYCSEHATLVAAATFPPLKKCRYDTATGTTGNNLTRNFLLEFSGARELTGITITADVWQIDFTGRLAGMDERIRLCNLKLYGKGCFEGNGWKLEKKGSVYTFQPGLGYVGGLRTELNEPHTVTIASLPCDVWLSVCLRPKGNDRVVEAEPLFVPFDEEVHDGIDELGEAQYRTLVASVDENGIVTDKRVIWMPTADGLVATLLKNNAVLFGPDGLISASLLPIGTGPGTICAGDDPRLSSGNVMTMGDPVITGSEQISIGYPATFTLSAKSLHVGGEIRSFAVTFEGETRIVSAEGDRGTVTLISSGAITVGDTLDISVTATDCYGYTSRSVIKTVMATESHIVKPDILSPSSGADIAPTAVTISTSDFAVQGGGTDTHASTDWRITRDFAGTDVVAEALESKNLLAYVFDAPAVERSSTYYIWARHNGTVMGSSEWGRVQVSIQTYGHGVRVENKATVIGNPDGSPFAIRGRKVWIAVLDAQYRKHTTWGPFIDTVLPNIKIVSGKLDSTPGNPQLGNHYIRDSTKDAQFDASFPDYTDTSKGNTDYLVESTTGKYPSATHCRSVTLNDMPCDFGTIDIAMRINKLREFIDANDPTLVLYPDNGIVKSKYLWSSTESTHDAAYLIGISRNPNPGAKSLSKLVAPILEIPA